MKKQRIKIFVFEQYFDSEFWDWDEKKFWFQNWEENKEKIFEEIYNRLKFYDTPEKQLKIALIIHDKDKKNNGQLIDPHVHVYQGLVE